MTEGGEEEEYDSDTEGDPTLEMPLENDPLTIVPDDRVEEVPAPKAKTSINSLRRMLSWLEVEKGILLTNRCQPVKGKRKKRYKDS